MSLEHVEIALLARLLLNEKFIESASNRELTERFQRAAWIQKGRRQCEWVINKASLQDIKRRLYHLLPDWEDAFQTLQQMGRNPCNSSDIEALVALRKMPPRKTLINRRNWGAVSGAGPKKKHKRASEDTITSDWVLRLRPNRGLCAMFGRKTLDLSTIADSLTECVIPQRGWMQISSFSGDLPQCIVTCENLGAFIDLPDIPGVCIVHAPGKDVGAAVAFLRAHCLGRWIHFGDIDPEGIRIAMLIGKRTDRPLDIYVPSFLSEYLDMSYHLTYPWGDVGKNLPDIEKLRMAGKGLLQEHYLLDKRLVQDLTKTINMDTDSFRSGR